MRNPFVWMIIALDDELALFLSLVHLNLDSLKVISHQGENIFEFAVPILRATGMGLHRVW